tara:strand:- start:3509 stop:3703 length:195 start_codon:yes stop_codon:yes gene_type:complete
LLVLAYLRKSSRLPVGRQGFSIQFVFANLVAYLTQKILYKHVVLHYEQPIRFPLSREIEYDKIL